MKLVKTHWQQAVYVPNPDYHPDKTQKYLCLSVSFGPRELVRNMIVVEYSWCNEKNPNTWYNGVRKELTMPLDLSSMALTEKLVDVFKEHGIPKLVKENFDICVKLTSTALKVLKVMKND